MANTKLTALFYVKLDGQDLWHIVVDEEIEGMTTACELGVSGAEGYTVRAPHNATTIFMCSVCEGEMAKADAS